MKKHNISFLILISIFTVIPLYASKKKRSQKKNMAMQLVRACKTGGAFVKTYSYDTYDFYKRFFSGKCIKKERKKAKRNLRWYRNAAIVLAALYGVKWKIDATKQEFKKFLQEEMPSTIEKQIRHPNPPPEWKRVFQALEDRAHEKGPQIKAAIKNEVEQEIVQVKEDAKRKIFANPVALFFISMFREV
jgi:hypothetical protein